MTIASNDKVELRPSEIAVRDLICAGRTSKEAAATLNISPRTVELHRDRLRKKYGARNTAELVRMVLLGQRKEAVSENAQG